MLQEGFQRLADIVTCSQHDTTQNPALPVDMLGRGVDDDVCPEFQHPAQNGSREHVVNDHRCPHVMGDRGHRLDVDHFKRRIGDAFQKHGLGIRPHCRPPRVQAGAVHEGDVNAKALKDLLQDIEA